MLTGFWSGVEEGEWDGGDAVAAAVGVFARVDDCGVDEVVADAVGEPGKVFDVGVIDPVGEFDFRSIRGPDLS